MTGNIVTDFSSYLLIAAAGGGCTYAVWQMLIDKPKRKGTP